MSTKKLLKALLLLCAVTAFSFSKTIASTVVVNSNVTSNTTWSSGNTYILVGIVYVTNNATLTINAGTKIQGDSTTKGSLVITRGAKINAVGTACQPILFTSEKSAGLRKRGDWGGIILLGYAQTNAPGDTQHIEGINPVPETRFGGGLNPNCGGSDCPNNADNSGTLQYVRIEFAGIALSVNNEINGLTMGGVGNGTTIDHIQVSYSNDDSYEWFGGSVNCKYLIAYDGIDDDFDTDNGFSGKIQFGLGMRDPLVADISGSKSYESDNDANGSTNTPTTSPTFQNMTTLGGSSNNSGQPLFKQSAHIRRNSKCAIYNSVMMGFPQGILVDGCSTMTNCATSSLLKNTYVQQASSSFRGYTPGGCTDQTNADNQLTANGNVYSTTYSGVLNDPDFPATSANDFVPATGNPLPASDATLYTGGFWSSVSYVGAFNPDGDAWAGDWTNFDPVNTNYPNNGIKYTPTIATTSITDKVCPNSGAINITPSGGFSPYSYSWSNGATTQDLSGITNGSYTVSVYDAGGLCSASKKIKVNVIKPILLACSPTSSTINVSWSANIQGNVSNYQIRKKKHSVTSWDAWITTGNVLSYAYTGLLSNTSYDFQLRGKCTSGNTSNSATLTCSTTARLSGESVDENGVSVNAYPNPSNGQFILELNGFASNSKVTVKITNTLGQVVYEQSGVNTLDKLDIDLHNSPDGLYQVQVSDGANQVIQSIVLNK